MLKSTSSLFILLAFTTLPAFAALADPARSTTTLKQDWAAYIPIDSTQTAKDMRDAILAVESNIITYEIYNRHGDPIEIEVGFLAFNSSGMQIDANKPEEFYTDYMNDADLPLVSIENYGDYETHGFYIFKIVKVTAPTGSTYAGALPGDSSAKYPTENPIDISGSITTDYWISSDEVPVILWALSESPTGAVAQRDVITQRLREKARASITEQFINIDVRDNFGANAAPMSFVQYTGTGDYILTDFITDINSIMTSGSVAIPSEYQWEYASRGTSRTYFANGHSLGLGVLSSPDSSTYEDEDGTIPIPVDQVIRKSYDYEDDVKEGTINKYKTGDDWESDMAQVNAQTDTPPGLEYTLAVVADDGVNPPIIDTVVNHVNSTFRPTFETYDDFWIVTEVEANYDARYRNDYQIFRHFKWATFSHSSFTGTGFFSRSLSNPTETISSGNMARHMFIPNIDELAKWMNGLYLPIRLINPTDDPQNLANYELALEATAPHTYDPSEDHIFFPVSDGESIQRFLGSLDYKSGDVFIPFFKRGEFDLNGGFEQYPISGDPTAAGFSILLKGILSRSLNYEDMAGPKQSANADRSEIGGRDGSIGKEWFQDVKSANAADDPTTPADNHPRRFLNPNGDGSFHWTLDIAAPGSISDSGGHLQGTNAKVGQNDFGMVHMHGNMAEICLPRDGSSGLWDGESSYDNHQTGDYVVVRGGGWRSRESDCRLSARIPIKTDQADGEFGFRIIIVP